MTRWMEKPKQGLFAGDVIDDSSITIGANLSGPETLSDQSQITGADLIGNENITDTSSI